MIKVVLFDLDGTLVHIPTNYKIIQEKLKNIFQTDEKFSPLIKSIITKANGDESKINEAFELICEQEIAAVEDVQVVQGMKDIINFLKTKDCLVCLVTMQCRKAATKILNELNIMDYFSNIVTRDESYDRFEQIQKTLEIMKINSDQALVIGDTVNDMECAKKAGCQHLLLSTKYENDNNLKIIKKLAEIKEVIK
ncbi:MAG TPA: HAD family hydrolase [Nitrosopumilaceae archaeon]|nr:HAD family hydrolase [Nitrosopumilaceae archaeon]